MKGKNNPMYGKKRPDFSEMAKKPKSLKHRQKISKANTGKKHPELLGNKYGAAKAITKVIYG